MLDHWEKDCLEKKEGEITGSEERMQYRAWIRGEPGRHLERDYEKMGRESTPNNSDAHRVHTSEPSTRERL